MSESPQPKPQPGSGLGRSRLLFMAASLMILLPLMVGSTLAGTTSTQEDSLFGRLAVLGDVLGLVQQAYVEPTSTNDLLDGALAGAVEALDPFSLFVGRESLDSFTKAYRADRRFAGMQVLAERGVVYVSGVEDGSPAAKAGLQRGDLLAQIDQVTTRGMEPWEIWRRLGIEKGTIALEVLRFGEPKLLNLEVGPAEPSSAVTVSEYGASEPSVVRPHRLDPAAVADLRAALARLREQQTPAIVLDLTGVFVGEPSAGWDAAALFVQGDLGELKAREETLAKRMSEDPPVWLGDLIVAVDHGTQGPAEVLAAALAAKNVRLVGQTTFGWAGRGEVLDLPGGDRVVLTTAWYTSPEGAALSSGLEPAVVVDDTARTEAEEEAPLAQVIVRRAREELTAPAPEEAAPVAEAA